MTLNWTRGFGGSGRSAFLNLREACVKNAKFPEIPWILRSLALLQGWCGPCGPKVAKRVRNEFLEPLGSRSPKSPKRSRKRVESDYFSTLKIKRLLALLLRTPRPATEPRNGQTRNFHEKYRKNTPRRPEILDSQNLSPKYPENTKKYPQNTKNTHFWYFFGIFSVFSWGSRISARGYFFGIFRGNSGSGHLGAL